MIGSIAKLYIDDEEKGTKYIEELRVQLKTNKTTMQKEWGVELVDDLEKFSLRNSKIPL